MEFVALDVETANADMSSICQIGLVHFVDGCLKEEWKLCLKMLFMIDFTFF